MDRLRHIPWEALRAEVAVPSIARVLAGAAAEREVERALRGNPELDRAERAAVVEAIFGVALWRRRLRWEIGAGAPAGALLASLLRDLAHLDEERALALAGVDALPRNPTPPRRLADRWSLPDWLEAHLVSELGAEAEAFCAAIAVPGPVCLRANRLLCSRESLSARLRDEEIDTRPAPRAPDALFVQSAQPNLFGTRAWRDGLFEPQDEGSQLLGMLAGARPGDTVLDLCAGAGGKSLLLAAQGARVLAHDVDAARLARLRARMKRARAEERIEIVGQPRAADVVFVDAPCSELGALRRGPDARWRIDPAAIADLPRVQSALLRSAAPLARRRIVYGTCTIHRAENEDVAERFEREHPRFRRALTWRALPHVDGTDGFFAAVWERA